jgi:hypothetical protein
MTVLVPTGTIVTGATYDPTLPTDRDHIRLALGDTDTAAPLIIDSTIDAMLLEYAYLEALALLADALIAEFGQMPDRYSDQQGVALQWTGRLESWARVATNARTGKIAAPGTGRTLTRRGIALAQTDMQRYGAAPAHVKRAHGLRVGPRDADFRSD